MRARIWGARGSLASPGADTVRYGGNTSCIEVRTDDGSLIVLDAGTGMRELGRSLLPVMPGNERQREMARRFGVNLVMYALTGNYKTDQVHVPALLERLGQ